MTGTHQVPACASFSIWCYNLATTFFNTHLPITLAHRLSQEKTTEYKYKCSYIYVISCMYTNHLMCVMWNLEHTVLLTSGSNLTAPRLQLHHARACSQTQSTATYLLMLLVASWSDCTSATPNQNNNNPNVDCTCTGSLLIPNLHPICTCSCLFTPLTEGRSARDLTHAAPSQKKNNNNPK